MSQRRVTANKFLMFRSQESEPSLASGRDSPVRVLSKVLRLETCISSLDTIPTLRASGGSITKKTVSNNPHKKEIIKPPTISKKELLVEIDDAKTRQEKFYSDIQSSIRKMRANDALSLTKQERNLNNFEKIQDHWANILNKANGKIGRSVTESVVARAVEHRKKKEQVDMLEITKPDEDLYGGNVWRMKLREELPSDDKLTKRIRGRSERNTRERLPTVEIIRHPNRTPTPSVSWRTSFFRTSVSTMSDRSIKSYMQERIKRNEPKLAAVRAAGEGIDTLILQGENVLTLESEAAFNLAEQDGTYPVILNRKKTEDNGLQDEEVIQENYEKKFFHMNGFPSLKSFKLSAGKLWS